VSGLALIGDRARFALGFALATEPSVGEPSWSRFELWACGRNLTAGITADGDDRAVAELPLLPIIRWFVEHWDPLLHEERLPVETDADTAARWRVESMLDLPSDDRELEKLLALREQHWQDHGLGAALPGFRVPDLHLRRFGNDLELSWDDREWRSVSPGLQLSERAGAAIFPAAEIVGVLEAFVERSLTALERVCAAEVAALRAAFQALLVPERRGARLRLATGEAVMGFARRLKTLVADGAKPVSEIFASLVGTEDHERVPARFAEFPTPVLLFRSAAPDLSPVDADTLATLCADMRGEGKAALDEHRVAVRSPTSPAGATAEGYERAMGLRERLGIAPQMELRGERDLEEVLLPRLGIVLRELTLQDPRVEALCIAGGGYRPTIAINVAGKFSNTPWGRRMSLAHELCHLLHDGDAAGRTGIVSNPWAPPLIERRANAFAVMLLAPEEALRELLSTDARRWSRLDLDRAMERLGIGATTLLWHLKNLRWISAAERMQWMGQLTWRR
jgi:Zn-dependent peptidase ImmA (M78 family)